MKKILFYKSVFFLSTLKKLCLSETICSQLLIGKIGHFLPVFGPYLEFFSSLLWQLKASLKYAI